jgi:hypothetical protein
MRREGTQDQKSGNCDTGLEKFILAELKREAGPVPVLSINRLLTPDLRQKYYNTVEHRGQPPNNKYPIEKCRRNTGFDKVVTESAHLHTGPIKVLHGRGSWEVEK